MYPVSDNVEDITKYMYQEESADKITELVELVLLQNEDMEEMRTILARQSSDIYRLKQEMRKIRGKRAI